MKAELITIGDEILIGQIVNTNAVFLSKALNKIGIEAYCPVRIEMRQWSDRKKKIKTPLLPSMLLVKIPNNLRELT